jgi:hypothetical protein
MISTSTRSLINPYLRKFNEFIVYLGNFIYCKILIMITPKCIPQWYHYHRHYHYHHHYHHHYHYYGEEAKENVEKREAGANEEN